MRSRRSGKQQSGPRKLPAGHIVARAERSYVGIHHRSPVKDLDWYQAMVAWKEDTRYMGLRWSSPLRTAMYRTS